MFGWNIVFIIFFFSWNVIFLIIFVFKIFRVVDSFWLNLIVELLFIVLLFDWFELGIIIRRMDIF